MYAHTRLSLFSNEISPNTLVPDIIIYSLEAKKVDLSTGDSPEGRGGDVKALAGSQSCGLDWMPTPQAGFHAWYYNHGLFPWEVCRRAPRKRKGTFEGMFTFTSALSSWKHIPCGLQTKPLNLLHLHDVSTPFHNPSRGSGGSIFLSLQTFSWIRSSMPTF